MCISAARGTISFERRRRRRSSSPSFLHRGGQVVRVYDRNWRDGRIFAQKRRSAPVQFTFKLLFIDDIDSQKRLDHKSMVELVSLISSQTFARSRCLARLPIVPHRVRKTRALIRESSPPLACKFRVWRRLGMIIRLALGRL